MHPDWTLRVPILRPRMAAWLDGAMMAAAPAAALLALYWQAVFSAPVLAAGGLACAGVWVGMWVVSRRRSRPAVSAVRMDRDGAFHLRLRDGWYPAEWTAAWRGPRWLTLRARTPAGSCNASGAPARSSGCVTFTVWQDSLPAEAWRRTCVLVNRRLCRAPSRPARAP